MIGLGVVYGLAGLLFAGFAICSARDRSGGRRLARSAFFALIAVSFLLGDRLGDLGDGVLALALVAVALAGVAERPVGRASGGGGPPPAPVGAAGDRLFALALVAPATTLLGALALKRMAIGGAALVDPKQATVVALGLGVLAALAVALLVLRARPSEPLEAGAALAGAVGWALVLPQMLAALGAVFALAGVGHALADLTARWLPADNRLAVVAAYTVGMAAFTVVMGNAFAAFPVMTAGIGMPLIVRRLHGDPAVMGSLGMLSGFCGTLLTPLAANFNIVPVALLDLPDRWAVIRVQVPTALVLLAVNTGLMYAFVFRF